jgi:hypothetical protein
MAKQYWSDTPHSWEDMTRILANGTLDVRLTQTHEMNE